MSLLETGTVRIGTLHEYRNIELHGTEVGDHGEGTKQTICIDSAHSPEDIANHPVLSSFIRAEPGATINISNVQFRLQEISSDYYVYSMSEAYDPDIAKNLDCDACIIIKQPLLFLSSIDKCLRGIAKLKNEFLLERCQYASRTQLFSGQHRIFPNIAHQSHPALIKENKYYYQREIRAIWEPIDTGIQPMILTCPDIAEYCEPFNE